MKRKLARPLLAVIVGLLLFAVGFAGNLEPQAPPGPTMVTLQQIYNKLNASLVKGHATVTSNGPGVALPIPNGVVLTDVVFTGGCSSCCDMTISDSTGSYGGSANLHLQSGILSDGTLNINFSCFSNGGTLMWTGYVSSAG